MARFCTCWLACCSLLLPFSVLAADTPVSADFFLQSIEPEPSATMLHDFLEIYGTTFAACKETEPYLRALTYLVANGDTKTVRDRLQRLEACPDLSAASRQRIAILREQTAEVRAPLVPLTPFVPAKPPVVPDPDPSEVPAPVAPPVPAEPAPVASIPQPVTPETTEPVVSAPTPATAETPPAMPELAQTAPPAELPTPPLAPTPAPSRAVHRLVAAKPSIRRTSLSVTPSIPIPVRTVPPTILTQPAPVLSTQTPPQDVKPAPTVPPKSPWRTEVASRAVYRTGHEGTSRLFRLENTASLAYGDWTFSATALHLNAGTAGNNEFVGSYFRGSPQRSLLTEQTAFVPQIAYDDESLIFTLGTSPVGGVVSPLPTFRLGYTYNHWKVVLFQESVTDSLLSYTGFRDPYTGQYMGRVMRSGMRLGVDDTFNEHWFYGGAVTGAYLYGKNVKENTQVRGELYIGRTFGSFAVGSYSAVDHYRTNLNNYTFGNGGYYSPYLAASTMLFASWEHVGKAGRIKADVSSGFLHETTHDSKQYYGTDGPRALYEGETHRKLTVNAGLEGSLNLAEGLSLDSSLRFINSGDFTEARGGLSLRWAF